MRGSQKPQIRVEVFPAADARERALFHEAQQLCLDGGGNVSYFIQEERAADGALEVARPRGERAGEGVFFVAEEFAFQQRFGQGGAVQRHERTALPRAVPVDHAGRERLAGAGRTADEHGRIAGAGVGNLDEAALHGRRRADDERHDFLCGRWSRFAGRNRPFGDQLADRLLGLQQVERLDQVEGRAEFLRRERILQVPMSGDDEDREMRLLAADVLEQFEPAHVRQADVDDGGGKRALREFHQSALAGVGEDGIKPEPADGRAQGGGKGMFVFDEQDAAGVHDVERGSSMVTTAPAGSLPTRNAPLCALTISAATVRPMPMPPSFSEKNSSA